MPSVSVAASEVGDWPVNIEIRIKASQLLNLKEGFLSVFDDQYHWFQPMPQLFRLPCFSLGWKAAWRPSSKLNHPFTHQPRSDRITRRWDSDQWADSKCVDHQLRPVLHQRKKKVVPYHCSLRISCVLYLREQPLWFVLLSSVDHHWFSSDSWKVSELSRFKSSPHSRFPFGARKWISRKMTPFFFLVYFWLFTQKLDKDFQSCFLFLKVILGLNKPSWNIVTADHQDHNFHSVLEGKKWGRKKLAFPWKHADVTPRWAHLTLFDTIIKIALSENLGQVEQKKVICRQLRVSLYWGYTNTSHLFHILKLAIAPCQAVP